MKHSLCGLLLFLLAVAAKAQTKADEQVVRRLLDAWAKHDRHELAKIMGDDVDFATVATTCRRGRAGARNSTFDFQRALPGIQHQTTVRFCGLIRRLALELRRCDGAPAAALKA